MNENKHVSQHVCIDKHIFPKACCENFPQSSVCLMASRAFPTHLLSHYICLFEDLHCSTFYNSAWEALLIPHSPIHTSPGPPGSHPRVMGCWAEEPFGSTRRGIKSDTWKAFFFFFFNINCSQCFSSGPSSLQVCSSHRKQTFPIDFTYLMLFSFLLCVSGTTCRVLCALGYQIPWLLRVCTAVRLKPGLCTC